jgi:hypothetical protein
MNRGRDVAVVVVDVYHVLYAIVIVIAAEDHHDHLMLRCYACMDTDCNNIIITYYQLS